MGFLDNLFFLPSTRSARKAPAVPGSRSRSRSESSPRQSDIIPLTARKLEQEARHVFPDALDIELAQRLLGHERNRFHLENASEEHTRSNLDDIAEDIPDDQETSGNALDRYITARSKNPGKSLKSSTDTDTVPSRNGTSRRARLRHKSSRGFAAVKKMLRHRRSELRQSCFDEERPTNLDAVDSETSPASTGVPGTLDTTFSHPTFSGERSDMRTTSPTDPSDSRRVSERTVLSSSSEKTAVTVCRRPSQRATSPITTVDPEIVHQTALKIENAKKPSPSSDSDRPELHAHPPRVPSSVYSDDLSTRKTSWSETSDSGIIYSNPLGRSHLSMRTFSQRLFSDTSNPSGQYRQQRAVREYNIFADTFKLHLLVQKESNVSLVGDAQVPPSETSTKRKDNFLRKIRSMRSSLRLRRPKNSSGSLRRMKTFASLSSQYYQMESLRGRSLETLARLGGCSYLTLPADFAPATLRLPVCIVATVTYLQSHGSRARHIFLDSGDLRVAVRIYEHFATQVLSAERSKERVDITMRGRDLPCEILGMGTESDAFLQGRFHALSVACVFKQVLVGLPGGILGSVRLYRTLVNICDAQFTNEEAEKMANELPGIPPAASARIRAIALAVLALTNDMQLELICAVFGLCALMIHESERVVEIHRHRRVGRGRAPSLSGLLDQDKLGRVFGPLLTGFEDETMDEERENETARVTKMMVENWRGVSRQLRAWEFFGFPVTEQKK